MNSEPRFAISRRWIECINLLVAAGYTANYKAFCDSIGIKPQSLNDIKAQRRAVTLDMIHDTCKTYSVGLNYLLTGTGAKLTSGVATEISGDQETGVPIEVQEQQPPRLVLPTSAEPGMAGPNSRDNSAFPLIDYMAAGRYLANYQLQDYYQDLAVVTLPPLLAGNNTRGILLQIEGDSMMPTFQHGDWVAGTLLAQEEWSRIRDLECCIIVSKPLGIQFKRVKNRLATQGVLRCESDNRHHPTYKLAADELVQLFRFVVHISPHTGKMENALYQKVEQLEESATALRAIVQKQQTRLEELGGPLTT